jgi:hypothetical protein
VPKSATLPPWQSNRFPTQPPLTFVARLQAPGS